MPKILKFIRLAILTGLLANAQHVMAQHPADQWEVGVETGYLTKVRHNSPLDYAIVPTQILWRSPALFDLWKGSNGARLAVRNRTAVVLETFIKGPEDYYFAFAGSPTFELWTADQKTAMFYEIGGGVGLLNSKHVAGGQGQNLTFNWFTQLGARHQMSEKLGVTGGIYFTHHSNLGMTDPNPGIDVVGLNFGMIWRLD
jgi:lipid A 3-O-deacylase